jgi:hypothetical protein
MFRPTDAHFQMKIESCKKEAERFGLSVIVISTSVGREIWLCRPSHEGAVRGLTGITENSPWWHEVRGRLCGVPSNEIDLWFHQRKEW